MQIKPMQRQRKPQSTNLNVDCCRIIYTPSVLSMNLHQPNAVVAAETGVSLVSRMEKLSMQGALMSVFGQAGGFFYSEASGFGKLIVSGMGSTFILDVEPNKDVIIDNAHVVAWDSRLQHKVSLSTNQGGGLMGRLVNSVTSGEGVVLRFSGKGKVVICSRNKDNFISWLRSSTAGNG